MKKPHLLLLAAIFSYPAWADTGFSTQGNKLDFSIQGGKVGAFSADVNGIHAPAIQGMGATLPLRDSSGQTLLSLSPQAIIAGAPVQLPTCAICNASLAGALCYDASVQNARICNGSQNVVMGGVPSGTLCGSSGGAAPLAYCQGYNPVMASGGCPAGYARTTLTQLTGSGMKGVTTTTYYTCVKQ